MAPSLVLSGFGELLRASGGQAWIGALDNSSGFDLGSPAPDTQTIARALFDGDIVSGRRTANRQITLPILIPANLPAVLSALAYAIDQPTYTLTLTPDGGLPVVIDCFRGQLQRDWSFTQDAQGATQFTATIPALPWTRSPAQISITSLSAGPTQVDAMDATTGWTATPAVWASLVMTRALALSTTRTQGSNSVSSTTSGTIASSPTNQPAGYDANGVPQYEPSAGRPTLAWARTFTAQDWSLTRTVGFPLYLPGQVSGSIVTVTLFDNTGKKWTWQATYTDYYTSYANGFRQVRIDTAASGRGSGLQYSTPGTPNLDFTHITGITVEAWALTPVVFAPAGSAWSLTGYLDDIERYPTGSGVINGPASVVRYDGIKGVARTPASLAIVPASAVGAVLLGRSPNQPPGFNPLLSSPQTGFSVADAAVFSGTAYQTDHTVGSTVTHLVYRIAAANFNNEAYAVYARMRWNWTTPPTGSGNYGTLNLTAQITGDTSYVQTSLPRAFSVAEAAASNAYQILPIGVLTLPPRGVPAQNTATTVDITLAGLSNAANIDEVYLVALSGDVLLIDPPGTYSRIWVDAPDMTGTTPKVFGGSAADRSDAIDISPWVPSAAGWNVDPGSSHVLVVLDNSAAGGTVTLSYFPRWHAERAS